MTVRTLLFSLTVFLTILSSFLIGIVASYYSVMGCLALMRSGDRRNPPAAPSPTTEPALATQG